MQVSDGRRVVTANLPAQLVERLDDIAERIDRSRSWIVRQALKEWLDEEQRRHELTLEGIADFEAGRTFTQEEVEKHIAERKAARRQQQSKP